MKTKPVKTKQFNWAETVAPYMVCTNAELAVHIQTHGNEPIISIMLQVALLNETTRITWDNGRKKADSVKGWRYALSAYVGGGCNMILLGEHSGKIRSTEPSFLTRKEAIKAALNKLVSTCEAWLQRPADSSRPYWNEAQGAYFSRPGREQLAYYLCRPEMDPLWQLFDEVNLYDNWLDEMRAPKQAVLSEQLRLF